MFSTEVFDQKYRIKWARRPNWDYSKPAWYFLTICTEGWKWYFKSSAVKEYAQKCWQDVPKHFPSVRLGEWVVMPNHFHAAVHIYEYPSNRVEPPHGAALQPSRLVASAASVPISNLTSRTENPTDGTDFYKVISQKSHQYIPEIVNKFKGAVTTYCNENHYPFLWEDRYHDHIIRTESALFGIEKYIKENPDNFEKDCFYVPELMA